MDAYTIAIQNAIGKFSSLYEIDQDIVDALKALLIAHGKQNFPDTVAAAKPKRTRKVSGDDAAKPKKAPRMNGYNMYVRQKFGEAKANGTYSKDLMAELGAAWKQMTDEEKQPYKDMAEEINATQSASDAEDQPAAAPAPAQTKKGASSSKKLNGYNLFYRERREDIKAGLEEGEKLMTKVGQVWKELTDDERAEYKERAAALSE